MIPLLALSVRAIPRSPWSISGRSGSSDSPTARSTKSGPRWCNGSRGFGRRRDGWCGASIRSSRGQRSWMAGRRR